MEERVAMRALGANAVAQAKTQNIMMAFIIFDQVYLVEQLLGPLTLVHDARFASASQCTFLKRSL